MSQSIRDRRPARRTDGRGDAEQLRQIVAYANDIGGRGRPRDAVAALDRALSVAPDSGEIQRQRARWLFAARDLDAAASAFEEACRLGWDDGSLLTEIGADLVQAGDMNGALGTYQRASELVPADADANAGLVRALIATGRADEALAHCDACIGQSGANTTMLTSKVAAHYAAGDAAGAQALMDFDTLVQWFEPDGFEGYASKEEFNASLLAHLRNHPTLTRDPSEKTTRGGFQSRELLDASPGPVGLLANFVRDSVGRYMERIAAPEGNAFRATPFQAHRLAAWGVILEGAGQQLPHYHPSAWISAVYYAQVPESVREAASGQPGAIQFGPPMSAGISDPERAFRAYAPQQGKLVIFPAFFFHGTIPTGSTERRVCFAFDVS